MTIETHARSVSGTAQPGSLTLGVTVTYNSAEHIQALLDSCLGQVDHMIVVDNDSRDASAGIAKSHPIQATVIENKKNLGLARAVNQGIDEVPDCNYLFLNPDVVLSANTSVRLKSLAESRSDIAIVLPRLKFPDGRIQESARRFPGLVTLMANRTAFGRTAVGGRVQHQDRFAAVTTNRPIYVHWGLGACLFLRRDAAHSLHGMNEKLFLYFEDVELCARAWRNGWRVAYDPTTTVTHAYARSSRSTFDFRNRATREHWKSTALMSTWHPGLFIEPSWLSPLHGARV